MSSLEINYPKPIGLMGVRNEIAISGIPHPIVPFPIDVIGPAAAAYSTRRLSTTYTGPLLRVRRDSDNAEMDIGPDAFYNLNEAVLIAFVGSANGLISVWYDQSGHGNNITQPIAAAQPFIAQSGTPTTVNSRIAPFFTGTNYFNATYMSIPQVSSQFNLGASFNVGARQSTFLQSVYWGGYFQTSSGGGSPQNNAVGWLNDLTEMQINSIGSFGSDVMYIDGVQITGPTPPQADTALHQVLAYPNTILNPTIWHANSGVGIAIADPSFNFLIGFIGELLFYSTLPSSALRLAGNANQKAYWNTP